MSSIRARRNGQRLRRRTGRGTTGTAGLYADGVEYTVPAVATGNFPGRAPDDVAGIPGAGTLPCCFVIPVRKARMPCITRMVLRGNEARILSS